MFCISISHKTAAVEIRELFAFTKEEQILFAKKCLEQDSITGCIVVSTCNRSEVYFTGGKDAISYMERIIAEYKHYDSAKLMKYYLIYQEEKAVQHLFHVLCGLDSMLLGEDEILGQVKDAYQAALEAGVTNKELNLFMQHGIACAKKVKTDTCLSKTPVSIGTLTSNEIIRFPGQVKKVLLIGITGKMGSTVYKNLKDRQEIHIIAPLRNHNREYEVNFPENVQVIRYEERYHYMEEADVIISATASPHYTITFDELTKSLKTGKHRLFLDLAVPVDIDSEIERLEGVTLFNIDYFEQLSQTNNERKVKESERAAILIEQCIDEVLKELDFMNYLDELPVIKQVVERKSFEEILYYLKGTTDNMEFSTILNATRKLLDWNGGK